MRTFDHFYWQNIDRSIYRIFNLGTGTCSCTALLLLLLMAQDILNRLWIIIIRICLSHESGRWNKFSRIICPPTSSGLIKKEQWKPKWTDLQVWIQIHVKCFDPPLLSKSIEGNLPAHPSWFITNNIHSTLNFYCWLYQWNFTQSAIIEMLSCMLLCVLKEWLLAALEMTDSTGSSKCPRKLPFTIFGCIVYVELMWFAF